MFCSKFLQHFIQKNKKEEAQFLSKIGGKTLKTNLNEEVRKQLAKI